MGSLRFILPGNSPPLREVKAGIQVEVMEEYYLLACLAWFSEPVFS